MEVILKQDVDDLGYEGDIVKVKKGYARNYLIPKDIAVESTPQNKKAFELQRKKIDARRIRAREAAEEVKKQIEALDLTLARKAGEEGKLFGSVTNMDIAVFLEGKGIVIDRKKIVLEHPVKELGEFVAKVKIYPKVNANLKGTVTPETES